MKRLILLLALLLPLRAVAQESALVQVELLPETVKVGEAARLHITVLGPTWFPKPPVFPNFEIPNAIVRLPPDSSHPYTAQVNGERWNGVSRYYEIYPLMPASYAVGGQSIRVTVANPGSDPIVVDAAIPDATLVATVPAGAEGLDPYLAGRTLTLSREIVGGYPVSLKSGDAVIVQTIAEIDGLPSIFLPPLNPKHQIDGVSVYPEEPLVADGDTGLRTEKLTLIFTAGGEFRLPAIELAWWNVDSEQIETASVPEMSFTVVGPPVPAEQAEEPPERDWKALLLQIAAVIVVAYLGWRVARELVARAKQRATEVHASEQYAFKQLARACAGKDSAKVYHALLAWLKRLDARMDAHRFVRDFGDERLVGEFESLSKNSYGDSVQQVEFKSLLHGLEKARRSYLKRRPDGHAPAIPPLNP